MISSVQTGKLTAQHNMAQVVETGNKPRVVGGRGTNRGRTGGMTSAQVQDVSRAYMKQRSRMSHTDRMQTAMKLCCACMHCWNNPCAGVRVGCFCINCQPVNYGCC